MMIKPDKNKVYVQNMLNTWPLDGTVTGGSSQKDMYGMVFQTQIRMVIS